MLFDETLDFEERGKQVPFVGSGIDPVVQLFALVNRVQQLFKRLIARAGMRMGLGLLDTLRHQRKYLHC